jgi:hypothetical protein
LALVGIGRWVARNERRRLIDFLARTVEARASDGSRLRPP